MVLRSLFPDILIPEIPVGQHVMSALDKFSERIALIEMHTDRKITFKQLKEKVVYYTELLWNAGLSKGDIVGLVLPFEMDYVPLLIAIVNCGAVIFGCKLMYRWSIFKQLDDIRPRLVIVSDERFDEVSTSLTGKIAEIKTCVSFSQLNNLKKNSIRMTEILTSSDKIDIHTDPVIIYQSSGTTGKPKGILHTHYNLMAAIEIGRTVKKLLPGDVFAGNISLMDAVGLVNLFQCLVSGVTRAYSPAVNHELFFHYVTKYSIVSYELHSLNCLLEIAHKNVPSDANLGSLISVFVEGHIYPSHILQQVSERLNGIVVGSEYGMTECFWITTGVYTSTVPFSSVGYLCPNLQMKFIRETDGFECGPNEKGQIYINGPPVMKGYYSSDKSETFGLIGGWLPTGDIGYFDQDNFIYVCGRIKDLIKIPPSGTAVLPIEFEEILLKHEKIKDVSVLAVPHPFHGEVAKAFVVRIDNKLSQDEVLDFFSSQVDSVLSLDGGVEFIDSIPKTLLGKPLKRELLKDNAAIYD